MTLERALNKFERHGYEHERIGQRVTAKKRGNDKMIELMLDRNENVVATRVKNTDERDNPEKNQYVGEWFPNVSQAIRFVATGRPE